MHNTNMVARIQIDTHEHTNKIDNKHNKAYRTAPLSAFSDVHASTDSTDVASASFSLRQARMIFGLHTDCGPTCGQTSLQQVHVADARLTKPSSIRSKSQRHRRPFLPFFLRPFFFDEPPIAAAVA